MTKKNRKEKLVIRLTDDDNMAKGVVWGTEFKLVNVSLPTTVAASGKAYKYSVGRTGRTTIPRKERGETRGPDGQSDRMGIK